MKNTLSRLSVVIVLCGISGTIGHAISFNTQSLTSTNTFVTSWFAAIFALSGLNLLSLLGNTQKSIWFELVVIVWLGCSSFISMVCLGYSQNWPSFAWVLITFVPVGTSALYLLRSHAESVSHEYQTLTVTAKVLATGQSLLKVLFMLLLSLLASGSILSAIAHSYPGPGQPISVLFDGANRNGTLQLHCIGTSNISKPTVFIFSSAFHGIVDLYGLQHFLSTSNGTNRRVCTHDPLGFGWSQDPFQGQFTNYEYLYRLMLSSGEPMPWHTVGWGHGGSAVMYLATTHTSSIKSVTFLETYPPGIEFNYYGHQKGLSQHAISEYRLEQLASRIGLVQLILSMAIPWGLMGLFIPILPQDGNYYPPERWAEFRVQTWKSKVWISQFQGIKHFQESSDSVDPLILLAPLPPQVPVFGVYCNITVTCEANIQNGQNCNEIFNQNSYYNSEKFSMLQTISANATVAENLEIDCDLSLPVKKPLFTALSILRHYSGIEP